MFRSFIYLDEKKVNSYKSILENKEHSSTKSVNKTKKTGVGFSAKGALNAEITNERSYIEEIESDPTFTYNEFEALLQNNEGDDYFDCVLNYDDYDIKTIPPMSIFKIKGYLEIPEAFDTLNIIEQFKPLLFEDLDGDENADIIKDVFSNTSADIPVIIDNCEILISGKLHSTHLVEEYASLEDYEDQEVVFLCKVEGLIEKENVTIFNPAKDFIKLNRSMRRIVKLDEDESFAPIQVEGPVLKVEIIAIYK